MRPFVLLIIFSALSIAGIAAIFSVTGIASVFSGHQLEAAVMMSSLEFGKIVLASLLYRFWKTMAWIHKSYMTLALIVLMIITSMGIFGFLSEAYQETKGDYTVIQKQVEGLQLKRNRFDENIQGYQKEKEQLDQQINSLILALQSNRIEYVDTAGNKVVTQSSTARKLYQQQLEDAQNRKENITQKIDAYSDSLIAIDTKSIALESQNIQGELGPLTYVASVFDTDMDNVVKWLILILIFVFDPLAVSLVVAANMVLLKKLHKNADERPEFTDYFIDKAKKVKERLDIKENNISKKTLETIDKSVENFKQEKISEPINEELDEITEEDFKPTIVELPDVDDYIETESIEKPVKEEKLEEKPHKHVKRTWKSANWREPGE